MSLSGWKAQPLCVISIAVLGLHIYTRPFLYRYYTKSNIIIIQSVINTSKSIRSNYLGYVFYLKKGGPIFLLFLFYFSIEIL